MQQYPELEKLEEAGIAFSYSAYSAGGVSVSTLSGFIEADDSGGGMYTVNGELPAATLEDAVNLLIKLSKKQAKSNVKELKKIKKGVAKVLKALNLQESYVVYEEGRDPSARVIVDATDDNELQVFVYVGQAGTVEYDLAGDLADRVYGALPGGEDNNAVAISSMKQLKKLVRVMQEAAEALGKIQDKLHKM